MAFAKTVERRTIGAGTVAKGVTNSSAVLLLRDHRVVLNRAEQVRERIAMRRRQAEAGVLLQQVAAEGIAELQRRIKQKLRKTRPRGRTSL